MVCMEKYLMMNEHYKAEEKNYGDYVKEHKYVTFLCRYRCSIRFESKILLLFRHKLEQYLDTLGFSVIPFSVDYEGTTVTVVLAKLLTIMVVMFRFTSGAMQGTGSQAICN